ncbi:MAG: TetR/AcrR family transcriptional regulator [Nocardioidaceae bacterium]
MPRGRDTKGEIIAVAMRMFVDRGYDKTALREIAEEIGVTKAALYYHFRTKEEIVRAAFDEHAARVDTVVAQLEEMPAGPERDKEVVNRLQELFSGDSGLAMRFGQVNPAALAREDFGETRLAQFGQLVGVVAGGERTAESDIRALLAFGAVVLGTLGDTPGPSLLVSGSLRQKKEATRRVALELLAGGRDAAE